MSLHYVKLGLFIFVFLFFFATDDHLRIKSIKTISSYKQGWFCWTVQQPKYRIKSIKQASLWYWQNLDETSRVTEGGHRGLHRQYGKCKSSSEVQHKHQGSEICLLCSIIHYQCMLQDFTVYLKPFWNKSLCSALPPGSTASFLFSANKVLIWMDGWIESKLGDG